MDQPTRTFERIIKEDRVARESKIWRGTFLEYLDLVREDPTIPKLAHARLYDMIIRAGTADIHDTDDPRGQAALQGRVAQGLQLLRATSSSASRRRSRRSSATSTRRR